MHPSNQTITELSDAELDAVGAAGHGYFSYNLVNIIAAVQTNVATQVSINVLSAGSGNQIIQQVNSVSVG